MPKTARRMAEEFHIASWVVHVRRADLAAARARIERLPGTEVHVATEDGRLVVTVESGSAADCLTRLDEICGLPGVLSTSLVFHQVDWDGEDTAWE